MSLSGEVLAQNGHPLVEALRPGGPQVELEPRECKVLVRIDDGVYVDPLRVACVRAVAVSIQGHVRVTLDNGDDFDVLHHDCLPGQPDTELADELMARLHRASTGLVVTSAT